MVEPVESPLESEDEGQYREGQEWLYKFMKRRKREDGTQRSVIIIND